MTEFSVDIIAGNELAFRRFYHHYFDQLHRFAFTFLRSPEEAEEVVSDVFLKIWLNKEQMAGVQNISTYLYIAVRNTSLNYLEKKHSASHQLKDQYLRIQLCVTASQPDDMLIIKENQLAVENAIDSLPPACKHIFRLVREDGLRYREVAEILGISVNTVNAQMAIAVKKISQSIRLERKSPVI